MPGFPPAGQAGVVFSNPCGLGTSTADHAGFVPGDVCFPPIDDNDVVPWSTPPDEPFCAASEGCLPSALAGVVPSTGSFPPADSGVVISPSGLIFQGPRTLDGLELALNVVAVLMNESEMDGRHGKDLDAVGPPFISDVEAAFLVQAFDDDLLSVEGGAVLCGILCGALAAIAPKNRPFTVCSPNKKFDINFYHSCTGHLCEILLREIAKQQGPQLTGILETCEPCVLI